VRVAKYYYTPGFWDGCSRGVFMVNQGAWDSLPEHYRHILEVACGEATQEMMARYDEANPQALRRLLASGAQLRAWPREVLQGAWRATNELYEEISAQNPRFRKMWTNYKAFRDEQFQWFRVAENAYENFAFAAAAQR
jgi:TRAP-type mannitol/chloroaromatic compound transport system substrate-binding protein